MELKIKWFNELTAREVYEIARSRTEVFLLEQEIICQDLDGIDYDSLHCFLEEDGRVVAYLRAFLAEDGTARIGRVLTLTHGQGLGRRLMTDAIPVIENTWQGKRILLHAQTYAQGFYERFGFVTTSPEFIEDGIPHVEMVRESEGDGEWTEKNIDTDGATAF